MHTLDLVSSELHLEGIGGQHKSSSVITYGYETAMRKGAAW